MKKKLSAKPGIKWAGGKNPNDNFFDEFYGKFKIKRVLARRNINSKLAA